MTENNKIRISPEYQKKLDKLESLKNELAKLISERDILENTSRKNLEALYATKIGKNEFTLFKLECGIARLKRKIELFQAKINHGQKPDIGKIEDKLDREYRKWEKEMSDMLENIENSRKRLDHLRSDEESAELQKTYRSLVKKLHPDVNDSRTEKTKMLWNRTMQAYKYGDLEELKAIAVLVEDVEDDSKLFQADNIDDRLGSIKQKVYGLMESIKKIRSEFPFTIENDIQDENWVAKKNEEIFSKIKKLEHKKIGLLKILDEMILENVDLPGSKEIN